MTYTAADIDCLARTIYGEDRGGGEAGMTAVAWVVLNRVNKPTWWGNSVLSVCYKANQFDCWNENDPNCAKIKAVTTDDPTFALAVQVATDVLAGNIPDPTHGATSYYARTIPAPFWAKGKVATADIGNQLYFKV